MKKLYLINELRYQTKYFFWNISRILKVRITSGITKYLADGKPHCSATYSSEAERGYLVLVLKPFCIHIRQESQSPKTKTHQAKTHKTCHSAEAIDIQIIFLSQRIAHGLYGCYGFSRIQGRYPIRVYGIIELELPHFR